MAERTSLIFLLAPLLLAASSLAAQSPTGAAVEGRILGRDSVPIEQAIVRVVNTSNGERWQTTTGARGRYYLDYLSLGGPYRIEVAAVGYKPAGRDSILLGLGQRLTIHFTLMPAVVELQEITVTATGDARFGVALGGPAQVITDSTIARIPVSGRDYTELAVLSPQITRSPNGGLSFAGQHDRYNSIQIDGVGNSDPFRRSFSGNGPPGWFVGLTAFTPEAVKELQLVSAPFDVRYGNFSGGLINAVTRSGSNRLEGSILGYLESSDLVGTDAFGSRGDEFSRSELGFSLGAPIVRDWVAVFLNGDLRNQVIPRSVPVPESGSTEGIRYEGLRRFQDLLRRHGVDPGGIAAGSDRTRNGNLFVKITAQFGVNSRLAVSHNYGHGKWRDESAGLSPGFYALSSAVQEFLETVNATRLAWTTVFAGRLSNDLLLARVDDSWTCRPASIFPAVSVLTDEGELAAGVGSTCLTRHGGTTVWEVTDNLAVSAGNHRLTFGVRGERVRLGENPGQSTRGLWYFDSLDSLEQGTPAGYERLIFSGADSQVVFHVNQLALYLQDEWLPTPRMTVTAGLRVDVPFLPDMPRQNPAAFEELGISTAVTPSGNLLWSPRLGVNYDLSGTGTTVLRGGIGLFTGAPPYVWFRNVYGSNGLRVIGLGCFGEGAVPDFTLDRNHQPTACAEPAPTTFLPVYFDPGFRFPQSLKLAVGADQVLPGGIVGTLDLLYTSAIHSVHSVDVNLAGPVGIATGEGGRALYGVIDPETGDAAPSRLSDELTAAYQLRNGTGDYSYSVTAQVEKRFAGGTGLSAAYTYTDANDRMSMDHNIAELITGSTPVDGSLEDRELRTSLWERPHKMTLIATTDLPLGFRLGLTYVGTSGAAYTYVALGDPNADGFRPGGGTSNDVAYVPTGAGDISLADPKEFAALERFIEREPCLRRQRGRLLERSSCRDPWVHETSARVAKRFRLAGARAIEVTADLFNVPNLLDADWGLVHQTFGDLGNLVPLLNLVGYDTVNDRGIYEFLDVEPRQIEVEASRWRFQLGATLTF